MKTVYLTIDDAPSEWMAARVALLSELRIPAVFFCTGDRLSVRSEPAIEAIRRGSVIGNHSWDHPHFSQLTLEQAEAEISTTDELIDRLYAEAGREREHRWFRFPFGDQGDDFAGQDAPPALRVHKLELQSRLRALGYSTPPFPDVIHPWFWPRGADADWYWTFDSMDWAVSQNELSVKDALARLDVHDPAQRLALGENSSADIVLLHDHSHSARAFESFHRNTRKQAAAVRPARLIARLVGRACATETQRDPHVTLDARQPPAALALRYCEHDHLRGCFNSEAASMGGCHLRRDTLSRSA